MLGVLAVIWSRVDRRADSYSHSGWLGAPGAGGTIFTVVDQATDTVDDSQPVKLL